MTSGFAAAAALQVSLTDRRASSGIHIATAHHAPETHSGMAHPDWSATHIIYMPGRSLDALAADWLAQGADPALPCVIVSRAAQPDQQIERTTLEKLHLVDVAASPSPPSGRLGAGCQGALIEAAVPLDPVSACIHQPAGQLRTLLQPLTLIGCSGPADAF